MDRSRLREHPSLLAAFGVVVLLASGLGAATNGTEGALAAAAGTLLAVLVVVALAAGLGRVLGVGVVRWRAVLVGGGLLFAALAFVRYGPARVAGASTELLVVVGSVGIGAAAGYLGGESGASGLVHGTLAGSVGGLLSMLLAVEASYTMRPALDYVPLFAGVIAPLLLGVLGGLGGTVGGAIDAFARSSNGGRR